MTTFTMQIFNNKFTNKKENPRILSNKLQKNNLGRQDDCETPFRNPYNHWRKTSTCGDTCKTNVKVLKDNVAINFDKPTCYNPYIRNILNKDGIRKTDFVFSKSLDWINLTINSSKIYLIIINIEIHRQIHRVSEKILLPVEIQLIKTLI